MAGARGGGGEEVRKGQETAGTPISRHGSGLAPNLFDGLDLPPVPPAVSFVTAFGCLSTLTLWSLSAAALYFLSTTRRFSVGAPYDDGMMMAWDGMG